MLKNRLPRSLGYVVAGCTLAVPVLAQNGADTAVLIRVTEGQSAEAARLSAAEWMHRKPIRTYTVWKWGRR